MKGYFVNGCKEYCDLCTSSMKWLKKYWALYALVCAVTIIGIYGYIYYEEITGFIKKVGSKIKSMFGWCKEKIGC